MEKQSYAVPLAIVIAGAFVAGAIFFTRQPTTLQPTTPDDIAADIKIRPVDATDHILGTPDAKVVFVEYSDTECPFCKRFHGSLQNLLTKYGKDGTMAWVYRHFPLNIHQKAPKEAEALECAAELGGNTAFWKYTDTIYKITPGNDGLDPAELLKTAEAVGLNRTAFSSCLESGRHKARVDADMNDAINSGGRATPFTIMQFKTAIPKIAVNKILSFNEQFGEQYISATEDNKTIVMLGSLPDELIEAIINLGLGK